MNTLTQTTTQTNQILNQLGTHALYMMGAKNIMVNADISVAFRIKGSRKCNHISIIHNKVSDSYTLIFANSIASPCSYTIVEEVKNIYVEQLHKIIEEKTELYLSI